LFEPPGGVPAPRPGGMHQLWPPLRKTRPKGGPGGLQLAVWNPPSTRAHTCTTPCPLPPQPSRVHPLGPKHEAWVIVQALQGPLKAWDPEKKVKEEVQGPRATPILPLKGDSHCAPLPGRA
jgi:hypothetical protein